MSDKERETAIVVVQEEARRWDPRHLVNSALPLNSVG